MHHWYGVGMSDRANLTTPFGLLPDPTPRWQRITLRGAHLCSLVLGVFSVIFALAATIAAWAIVTGSDRAVAVTVTKFYGYPAVIALVFTAILRGLLWRARRLKPMTLAPQRRFFRFSLRALFVTVSIAAILTAWAVSNYRWARQRRAFLSVSGRVNGHERTVQSYYCEFDRPFIKWLLFGERRVTFMNLYPGSFDDAYLVQVRNLFPEAEIISSSDPNALEEEEEKKGREKGVGSL
jgi:hypothetical protein